MLLLAGLLILNVAVDDPNAQVVGAVVPLPPAAAVPAGWRLADGTPLDCADVPKLCSADPNNVAEGKWNVSLFPGHPGLTGMRVDFYKNSRFTKWIVKVD